MADFGSQQLQAFAHESGERHAALGGNQRTNGTALGRREVDVVRLAFPAT